VDPYRTLGVPKGCTREEVKETFRAKLTSVHPDRGGDDAAFIQVRAAYEQILAELDRRPPPMPNTHGPARAPHNNGAAKPVDPGVASKASDVGLHRAKAYSEHQRPRTRPPLGGMLAATFLPPAVLCLILYFLQLNSLSPIGNLNWKRDIIPTFGFMAVAVIGVWIRDELSERYRRSGRSESKDTKDTSKLFDEF
jgi:DnaJ domain